MITDSTLLVRPDVALAQKPATPPGDKVPGSTAAGDTERVPESTPGEGGSPIVNRTFRGTYRVDPERYSRDLTKLSQEVLQHLAAAEGVELEVIVEIRATSDAGFPDDKARVILENASALKFDHSSFDS